ncbi:MAG: ABC transporter substrate-binding protein [Deltaproteobacteria bacterium]|nr:ABC transporter substrate-binding protein [Deltaproteobacteria bacterium]MBT4640537.1 ABC transporter substrate-binding protein [Deltaproteobacteria bacterium]MBT6499161.1 ABC transporter substrate-binding protein [Deltaproteobacteria bacterium]MBT6612244.1 ABC transporter substrate-binding protein [Deltaproteobacteria bacterium]MBT7713978.1 ABC transporter substrate-binding protein [Deltaproteobacteria bacterium]
MSANTRKGWKWVIPISALAIFFGLFCASPGFSEIVPKGKLVYVSATAAFEATGGDPHTAWGGQSMQTVNTVIHEALMVKKQDGRVYPALAKTWKFAADLSHITITLDKRAKFHNGEPVTAADVKFSYDRAARPELKFALGGYLRMFIDRVEVVNKHKVVVHFKIPWATFVDGALGVGIIPKAYTEKVGDKEFAKHPIGAGPFKWLDFKQDDYWEAEAVADHYRKVPYIKFLRHMQVAEDATRLAMLKTGEADMAGLAMAQIGEVKKDSNLRVQMTKYGSLRSISFFDMAFPDKASPWHDIRVRKALDYAIDRESICKYVLHGTAEPWGDVLAPYNPGYDPTIKPRPYDPKKARQLLKEAGYPNGFKTTLTTNLFSKAQTEAIAALLRDVGIIAKLNIPEEATWASLVMERKLSGIGSMPGPWWGGYIHPSAALTQLMQGNAWGYVTTPEQHAGVMTMMGMVDEKALAVEAKKVSKFYREQMTRINLWARHSPDALGPRIAYWESVPGFSYASLFEYLKLKD